MTGPVQVLVVGFNQPAFSGEVVGELARLREAGIVRLVDLLLVKRAEDGTIETLDAPGGMAGDVGRLASTLLGRPEVEADAAETMADADPIGVAVWSLADAVPRGSTAAVALIEHVWAEPLMAAIRRAGGTPLEETWLASDDRAALDVLIPGEIPGEPTEQAEQPTEQRS